MLNEIEWKRRYKSRGNPQALLNDFFRPALNKSMVYLRGTGFFSSSMFHAIGEPLGDFIERGGSMKIITNVQFSEQDRFAVEQGEENWGSIAEGKLMEIIESDFRPPMKSGALLLTKLLEMGRLEIKIGVKSDGIYHEKIGLFFDNLIDIDANMQDILEHNHLAFFGSVNEGVAAWERSHENIKVYPSWVEGRADDAADTLEDFIENWRGETDGLGMFDFPEAARLGLIQSMRETDVIPDGRGDQPDGLGGDPKWVHQDEAVELFLAPIDEDATGPPMPADGAGILYMATGTGKTWTAFKVANRLIREGKIKKMVIETYGTDLLDQWYGEVLDKCPHFRRVKRHYNRKHESGEYLELASPKCLLISREAFSTFVEQASDEELQETLLIIDECHNMRGAGHRKAMEGKYSRFRYRLGLSATPLSEYDAEANEFLTTEIGPIFYEFGLIDAIQKGILCPFDYIPIDYTPSDDDVAQIASLIRYYAAKIAIGEATEEQKWQAISRVYKKSEEKIQPFLDRASGNPSILSRSMIFVLDTAFGSKIQTRILAPLSYRWHTYYSSDDKINLTRFAQGELECLITCKKLSEGIDVKDCSTIILLSSDRAKLTTIQRIGRALRTDPNNPEKVAMVVDFIGEGVNADMERQDWLTELSAIRPGDEEE
uniref:DNA or RNA superfamily II helicase n=1 Tax=uncultured marine group II/III euryarchaeote KM3_173_A11 TaxID=1457930 RepID=A0A075GJZ2_9EURY|nr:DNA or RNA superfamily II helicase [uncultured marine group II/III euryarchaeote KM3_173_A11]